MTVEAFYQLRPGDQVVIVSDRLPHMHNGVAASLYWTIGTIVKVGKRVGSCLFFDSLDNTTWCWLLPEEVCSPQDWAAHLLMA